jgi:hypothetical protein
MDGTTLIIVIGIALAGAIITFNSIPSSRPLPNRLVISAVVGIVMATAVMLTYFSLTYKG